MVCGERFTFFVCRDLRSNAELTELSAEAFLGLTSLREL